MQLSHLHVVIIIIYVLHIVNILLTSPVIDEGDDEKGDEGGNNGGKIYTVAYSSSV